MRLYTILFVPIFLLFSSCGGGKQQNNILGVWGSFQEVDNYVEILIDTATIRGFSELRGTILEVEYKYNGDSMLFLNRDFSAAIQFINDTSFRMAYDMSEEVYFKLSDSLINIYKDPKTYNTNWEAQQSEFRRRMSENAKIVDTEIPEMIRYLKE